MAIHKITREGSGGHFHNYEESATGYWEWCEVCVCMVNSPCDHEKKLVCHERSEYIRLRRRYEVQEVPEVSHA